MASVCDAWPGWRAERMAARKRAVEKKRQASRYSTNDGWEARDWKSGTVARWDWRARAGSGVGASS